MNEWKNLLLAVVNTGDDSNMGKWIVLLVIFGIILVAMAVASVVISKKKKAEVNSDKEEKK